MRKNMHVGLVTRGDIAYTLDLANLLYKAGLSITLYLPYDHAVQETGSLDRPLERLYETELLPAECRVRLIKPPRMRNLWSLIVYLKLSQTIQADGLDVVHILAGPDELWVSMLAGFVRTVPVVGTMIVPKPNVGGSIPAFFNKVINKLLALGSEMIIVNGSEQVDLVQNLYGVSSNQVVYVPLNARSTALKWSVQGKEEESGTILFFGAARFHKGLEYLVKAQPLISSKVPFARILISAHGDDLQRCRQMIKDNSKFEIYEGFISGEGMAALFQRASLVVLPYLSASTSGVLVTAYSFGKPVVATNVGCLPEYVENHVTGLLVEPANESQLAEAIIDLLTNDSLRHRMGKNSALWIEAKNNEIIEQTIKTYEKAIVIGAKS